MPTGYLSLILHAHLPFIRHPEHEDFLEEDWLFEAITECYLPLLDCLENLHRDRIPFRLTLDLSPTLCAMLQDDLLQSRYVDHMENLIALADKECARTVSDTAFHALAVHYRKQFSHGLESFENCHGRDLVAAFRRWQDTGAVELITCAATHGYLPLLKTHPSAVRAQLSVGQESFRRAFGRPAPGVWLPECAYFSGLESVLDAQGLRYFFVDSHGLQHANVRPHYGLLAPVACPNGVAAFARDPDSSRQVWSTEHGYPGDPQYREFYRDIGFDLDFDYISPHILDGTTRVFTGIKYYRITGKTEEKKPYHPAAATEQVRIHAEHFLSQRQARIDQFAPEMDRPPLIVSPYDAELFGHWWYEGPQFIEALFRVADAAYPDLEWITPGDYLDRHPILQQATPSASSWGSQGYNEHWLSRYNDWIYPHLNQAAKQMHELACRHAGEREGTPLHRALNQAARSLLIAQASDWAFILKNETSVAYAQRHLEDHLARFRYLAESVENNTLDPEALAALEEMDNLFPWIDFRVFGN